MGGVKTLKVRDDEAGMRVDRWFRQRFPSIGHSRVQKWLRTGQVRIDGGRVKASARLQAGQQVRVPPLGSLPTEPVRHKPKISKADDRNLKARVLHRDDDVLVIDKPAGLAVQGGSGLGKHLDAMLDALRFGARECPRLAHRLDKDTSGVLVLARNGAAARKLTAAFRSKQARKLYWAVVVGVPRSPEGIINLALAKRHGRGGEKVSAGVAGGKKALTRYRVIDRAGGKAAWVAFEPETGRTHQLRVHAVAMETPILGDGKYGGREAFIAGEDISRRLHLHAKNLRIPHPAGGILEVSAPLPDHMRATFRTFGFDNRAGKGLFQEFKDLEEP